MTFGTKSGIGGAHIDGDGVIEIGNYTQISWNVEFEMDLAVAHKYKNEGHDYHSVAIFDPIHFCFPNPKKPVPHKNRKPCRILIGNDVWIGRGCKFKVTDPDRPLVIGDGAVVASDSVVVKSVEPYTIVGGNPARFIKYRFEHDVIEGLQRIRWWERINTSTTRDVLWSCFPFDTIAATMIYCVKLFEGKNVHACQC